MTRIAYTDYNPQGKTRKLIEQANAIIAEYEADGYDLTLRQLFYQFVSRDLLANSQQEYSRLGGIISKARRGGLISWDAIVDRTRHLRGFGSWSSPKAIVDACAASYRVDPWDAQDWRVEVWFEKDALLGVFERACQKYRIPHFSCRGYASDSEVWAAAQRLKRSRKDVLVLHFGDHDPSGIDMSGDIDRRLSLFRGGSRVEVRRIALTMDQVEEYNPPPNPAKETDSRFAAYRLQYGDSSWELDALDPRTLSALVLKEVEEVIDQDAWAAALEREEEAREDLRHVAKHFADLATLARQRDGGPAVRAAANFVVDTEAIREAITEDGWCPIVYSDDEDGVLIRELGFSESGSPGMRARNGDVWYYNDIEELCDVLGSRVWADLAAYRAGQAWRTTDVMMVLSEQEVSE